MLKLNLNWVSEMIKYLHQWQAVVKSNFQEIQTAFNNHLSGIGEKHNAQSIDYTGDMPGDNVKSALDNHINAVSSSRHNAEDIAYSGIVAGNNVKAAIDNMDGKVNNLSFAGVDHDPLVTAALIDQEGTDFGPDGEGTYLNGRLLKWEQKQLSHLSESVSIKQFGAKGDGESDDTIAIQNAINTASTNGKTVVIPDGIFLTGELTLPRNVSINIVGVGMFTSILKAKGSNTSIFKYDGEFSQQPKSFFNFSIDGDNLAGTKAFDFSKSRNVYFSNIGLFWIEYGFHIDQSFSTQISDIFMQGAVSNKFFSSNKADEVGAFTTNLVINGVLHDVALGGSEIFPDAWFTFDRAINCYVNNVNSRGLNGVTDGFNITGRCEGLFISNTVIVWPKNGFYLNYDSGSYPYGVEFTNCSVDQFTGTACRIDGIFTTFNSCSFLNGMNNTEDCVIVSGTSNYIYFNQVKIARTAKNGLTIGSGAKNIVINGLSAYDNGTTSGYDLFVPAIFTRNDIKMQNCDVANYYIPSLPFNGHEITNQLYKIIGATVVTGTTEITVFDFTLPANSLKPQNKIEFTVTGYMANNANLKEVYIKCGSSIIAEGIVNVNDGAFVLKASFIVQNMSSQLSSSFFAGKNTTFANLHLPNIDLTHDATFSVTAKNTVSGDISIYSFDAVLL